MLVKRTLQVKKNKACKRRRSKVGRKIGKKKNKYERRRKNRKDEEEGRRRRKKKKKRRKRRGRGKRKDKGLKTVERLAWSLRNTNLAKPCAVVASQKWYHSLQSLLSQ